MKVLLFVQNGDARPKCVLHDVVERHGAWCLSWRARDRQAAADRWWLVECENAEAGRDVIAGAPVFGGRIIASGGRHE